MSTRGFVGFKKNGEIKGWYNGSSSYYDALGRGVLDYFTKLNKEELNDFFLNRLRFGNNPEGCYEVWEINWKRDSVTVHNGSDFLNDGLFCEYGYVFNLDEDTLELYRGGFTTAQNPSDHDKRIVSNLINGGEEGYFTHLVGIINRTNIQRAIKLFNDWDDISNPDMEEKLYPERKYLGEVVMSSL